MACFLGVVPKPSSFLKASTVAATSPDFIDCALDRERVDSERCNGGLLWPDTDPGGVRTVERFCPEDDPRRNWLIDAVEGLGGRCEKSLGAM